MWGWLRSDASHLTSSSVLCVQVLNLDGNKLSLNLNSIPQNSVIESLTLSHAGLDSLEGVGHAKNLRQLVASNNNLAGSVPGELFNLSDLIQVDLSQNGLEGTLDSFTALTNLKVLSLSDNKFQGSIPKLINRLSNLKAFSASENLLSGTIPKEINELRLLERLSLHSQHGLERIEGSLPDFAQSSEMRYVDLANNDISGEIPSSFLAGVNATKKAVVVILEGNNIGGTVPLSLERLEQLDINLADNRIEALPNALCKKGNW
jgi:Leucine-rich repeat (LRR) protein